MSWAGIRDGVKTRLDTISGLSARDTLPDVLPDRDTATVLPSETVLEPAAHNGMWVARFQILVRCVRGKLKDSQDGLDEYIDPAGSKSVIAAVFGDRTLGGTVDDVKCLGVTNYRGVDNSLGVQALIQFEAYFGA